MLKVFAILVVLYAVVACGEPCDKKHHHDHAGHHHDHDHSHHDHDHHDHNHDAKSTDGNSFGEALNPQGAMGVEQAIAKVESGEGLIDYDLGEGETIKVVPTKVEGVISEVCQAAGCWLKVKAEDGTEVFVDTKHAFLFPKDITGKTIVIEGNAFKTVQSVEEQRHYMQDAGDSEEAIAAITEPKTTYTIVAKGALVK